MASVTSNGLGAMRPPRMGGGTHTVVAGQQLRCGCPITPLLLVWGCCSSRGNNGFKLSVTWRLHDGTYYRYCEAALMVTPPYIAASCFLGPQHEFACWACCTSSSSSNPGCTGSLAKRRISCWVHGPPTPHMGLWVLVGSVWGQFGPHSNFGVVAQVGILQIPTCSPHIC